MHSQKYSNSLIKKKKKILSKDPTPPAPGLPQIPRNPQNLRA